MDAFRLSMFIGYNKLGGGCSAGMKLGTKRTDGHKPTVNCQWYPLYAGSWKRNTEPAMTRLSARWGKNLFLPTFVTNDVPYVRKYMVSDH